MRAGTRSKLFVDRVGVADRQRIEAAERTRPRNRIEGLAVASAEHRLIVDAVGRAETRREQRLAHLDPVDPSGTLPTPPSSTLNVGIVEHLDAAILARHQRVVLVAQAEVEGQLLRHVPAVADERAVLVLAAAHRSRTGCSCRNRYPGRGGTRRTGSTGSRCSQLPGEVAREAEIAARTRAELRLPVIQLVADEVEAGPDLVRAHQLRQVRGGRVAGLVPLEWRPSGVVAERAHAGLEIVACRSARGSGPFVPGNAECLATRSSCRSRRPARSGSACSCRCCRPSPSSG